MILDISSKAIQWRKDRLSKNGAERTGYRYTKDKQTRTWTHTSTKHVREKFCYPELSNEFLDIKPEPQSNR